MIKGEVVDESTIPQLPEDANAPKRFAHTRDGKPPVLEALEREEEAVAAAGAHGSSSGRDAGARLARAEEGAAAQAPMLRLTAARWMGGLRCRGATFGYRGKSGQCRMVPSFVSGFHAGS